VKISLLATWGVLLASGISGAAVPPFLAPAQSSGTMQVRLYPTEVVATGTPVLVTFGVPFTRGSLAPARASTIRVLDSGGQEIPAHVEVLTPWRHLTEPAIDGASIRFARVQIHHTFSAAFPAYETVTVEWGHTTRAQDVASLVSPRSAWHLANSGDWSTGDNVAEPDVYAVLPKALLADGVFRMARMIPATDGVPEAPENWAVTGGTTYPGYEELDHGEKNFFHTVINDPNPYVGGDGGDGGGPNPYKVDYEPWLYDRAATMFALYFRTGYFTVLREAVRNAEFYRTHLDSSGKFTLKPEVDLKYVYNECTAYALWATGDDAFRDAVVLAAQSQENPSHDPIGAWTPTSSFWTERHTGFRLLANVVAFEVTGDSVWRSNTLRDKDNFVWHQNGAPVLIGGQMVRQIPADAVDGPLYHYGVQHDWDWVEDVLGASPWMSTLVMDPMLRVYGLTESTEVGEFIRRMGVWEKVALGFGDMWMDDVPSPWYRPDYGYCYGLSSSECSGDNDDGNGEHAHEVTGAIGWGIYFSDLLGSPDATLRPRNDDLYITATANIKNWTRAAAPHFRVSPPRKWAWQYRTSGSLSFCMFKDILSVGKGGDGAGTVTSNDGGIACGADCSQAYAASTPVTLTAVPAAGSAFSAWSGDCAGSATTCQLTIDTAKTVTATFVPASTPSLSIQNGSVVEGDSGSRTLTLGVTLTQE
jgi:hypothetical protein